ncbi:MAG TPA: hypothetical protein VNO30_05305 [Kofleriaceae bacterium]|nr:hypothetical protein [Kofleriaceae bacterium]
MPSSTFSSEPRKIPGGRWGATWLVALALAVAGTWRLELLTRAGGQRPSVVDDPYLWSLVRRDVDEDPRIVAFLGASRMALGYSAQAFAEAAPKLRGVQLSISDYLPFEVFEDLADDASFRGVVVLDFMESEVADPLGTDGENYVARARALWRAPGALANRYLASHAQAHLAVLAVGGRRIVTTLAGSRRWPAALWVAIDRERGSHGDYSLAPPAALRSRSERRAAALRPPLSPEGWLAVLERQLEPQIQRIRARGGEVVVVHMPISGLLATKIDELYPRRLYWDAFAARTSARVIHFRDVPALAQLACPDDMHLDQRDQAAFTRVLVDVLRERGVLRGRE